MVYLGVKGNTTKDLFMSDKVIKETRHYFYRKVEVRGFPVVDYLVTRYRPNHCSVCTQKPKWYNRFYLFEVIKQRENDIPFEAYLKNNNGCGSYIACSKPCREIFTLAVV